MVQLMAATLLVGITGRTIASVVPGVRTDVGRSVLYVVVCVVFLGMISWRNTVVVNRVMQWATIIGLSVLGFMLGQDLSGTTRNMFLPVVGALIGAALGVGVFGIYLWLEMLEANFVSINEPRQG